MSLKRELIEDVCRLDLVLDNLIETIDKQDKRIKKLEKKLKELTPWSYQHQRNSGSLQKNQPESTTKSN